MRKIAHVGCYTGGRPQSVPVAAGCGDFVIMDAVTLLHTPGQLEAIRAFGHLRIVVQLHILDEVWTDPDYDWVQLAHIRGQLEQAGLWDRVLAVIVDEECMTGAYGGGPQANRFARLGCTDPDPFRRIDWVCDRLAVAVRSVKRHMPGKWVGHVETCWHAGRQFGAAYYRPVPFGLDWVGVDAYVHGPLSRAEFARQVRPILAHLDTLDMDVLVVAQAFEDSARSMPSTAQLQWWLDAAPARTVGLAWFTLEHPGQWAPDVHGYGRGLLDYPDRLEAVRWYARVCGLVPDTAQVLGGA